MIDSRPGGITFVCPSCEGGLEVNDPMKVTLLEMGCVLCGSVVTEAAFSAA